MSSRLLLETGDDLLLETGDFFLLEDPDLRWLPHYPARVPPRVSLGPPSQRTFIHNVSPIVNPPPPTDMPAMPTFPAQVFRTFLPRAVYQFTARGQQFLGFDLRNRAVYPDRFPARRFRPYAQSFEIGGVLNVPKTGGWRPRYPDRLSRRLPVRTGLMAYQPPPSIFVTSVTCINWTDLALVQPLIDAQLLTEPTITTEALIQPTISVEGVC